MKAVAQAYFLGSMMPCFAFLVISNNVLAVSISVDPGTVGSSGTSLVIPIGSSQIVGQPAKGQDISLDIDFANSREVEALLDSRAAAIQFHHVALSLEFENDPSFAKILPRIDGFLSGTNGSPNASIFDRIVDVSTFNKVTFSLVFDPLSLPLNPYRYQGLHLDFTLPESFDSNNPDTVQSATLLLSVPADAASQIAIRDARNNSGRQLVAGDADGDLDFDQFDLIQVQTSARFLTNVRATWGEGDWTGDGVFNQFDIIAAQQTGNYLRGPYAVTVAELPEPAAFTLLAIGFIVLAAVQRRKRPQILLIQQSDIGEPPLDKPGA